MISLAIGVALSLVVSSLYVLVLNSKHEPNRNDPKVIKSRIISITFFTLLTVMLLPPVLSYLSGELATDIWHHMGLEPAMSALDGLLLVMLLFIGPLLDDIINNPPFTIVHALIYDLTTFRGLRDLVLAPITEEVVYTSAIITILNQTGASMSTKLFMPPAFFSIAHIHHAYELYVTNAAPLNVILTSTLFQVLYTYIFGVFTDFLFIRQGTIWGCILTHAFCNFMGLPNVTVSSEMFKWWPTAYYTLILLGVYGFKSRLYTWTE